MGKTKAQIRFSDKAYKTIKWFTKNFDDEIGALGLGKLENGVLYVKRLVFPQQIVNGAHVHFKPEDWGPIVAELTPEELGSIIFYWHKHPNGMPGASQGDEDDTFDTFMAEEAGRKCMGFLQTAANTTGGGFTYEARIELRDPIKVSITDVEIVTDDDVKVEKECVKIIKKHISFGSAGASDQPGTDVSKDVKKEEKTEEITTAPSDDPVFKVENKNGQLILNINTFFETWIVTVLNEPEITTLLKEYTTDRSKEKDGEIKITVKPRKKCIKKIFSHFKQMRDEMFYDENEKDLESSIGNTKLEKLDDTDKKIDDQINTINNWYKD